MADPIDSEFRYEAFISYSHDDERRARRLHTWLEQYRIPRRLISEHGFPSDRLLPVFRDQDELASSADLTASLVTALEESRNLIVLLSPSAARSRWVNEEIRRFRSMGRGNRILCALVAGQLSENLPPALKDAPEPMVVNLAGPARTQRHGRQQLMAALLNVGVDELRQRNVERKRRRLMVGSTGSATALGLAIFFAYRAGVAPPCEEAGQGLAGIWNTQVEQSIRAAFKATALPFAAGSAQRVIGQLGDYGTAWSAMAIEACEATQVRGEQSAELMDLRMRCLDERRTSLTALIGSFTAADDATVERSIGMTNVLPRLARCADPEQLLAAYPLPDDPDTRAEIEAVHSEIAEVRMIVSAGQPDAARPVARALNRRTEKLDYPPVTAEAQLLLGIVEGELGHVDAAKKSIYSAASEAARAKDPELVAGAWLALQPILTEYEAEYDDALNMVNVAEAYVTQLDDFHPLRANFHNARGRVLIVTGELDQGERDMQQALAIARQADLPDTGKYITDHAYALMRLHRLDEARVLAVEALERIDADFGPFHPRYAAALEALSRIEAEAGNLAEAAELQQHAVEITEAALPPEHIDVAERLSMLAWRLNRIARYEEAVTAGERSLGIQQSFETPPWGMLGATYNTMADIHLNQEQYPEARDYLEQAVDAWSNTDQNTDIGVGLNNLGNLANRTSDYAAARDYCLRALANDEGFLPADHPGLAFPLSCLGEAYMGLGEYAEAIDVLNRAEALRDRPDPDRGSLAWTRWLLGKALWESDVDRAQGAEYVRFARGVLVDLGPIAISELADVDRWLVDQGLGPGVEPLAPD